MYILDTNVVSEQRKPKPHGAVLAWLADTPAQLLYVAAPTLGELQAGLEITRAQDEAKALAIGRWIDALSRADNILPMDGETFRIWARLMHGKGDNLYEDAMIAATAVQHGMTVVTRNVRDFEVFQVPTLNPFSSA